MMAARSEDTEPRRDVDGREPLWSFAPGTRRIFLWMFIPQCILVSVLNTIAKWPSSLDVEEILGLWRDIGAIVGTSALVSWAVLEIGVAFMVISGIFLERLRERRARNREAREEEARVRAERDSLRTRVERLEQWGERYQAAVAEGKPFDEPIPSSNGEDRGEEHTPTR